MDDGRKVHAILIIFIVSILLSAILAHCTASKWTPEYRNGPFCQYPTPQHVDYPMCEFKLRDA